MMEEGKNIIENESNFDAHDTLVGQDGGIVLNESESFNDNRGSLDKGRKAFNRKEELRRQRREKEIRELKALLPLSRLSLISLKASNSFKTIPPSSPTTVS